MNSVLTTTETVLRQMPTIRLAIVFGSIADGRASAESDIDIAVATDKPLLTTEKIGLIERIATALGRPVDLIDLGVASGPILHQALTRGRIVKCEDRALYARLLLKMLYNQTDEMPYRRLILDQRQQAWTRV